MIRCTVCDATTDAFLCHRCTYGDNYTDKASLEKLITDLPVLLEHLITTITRQDRLDDAPQAIYGRPALDAADKLHAAIPARLRSRQGRIALPSTPWAYQPDSAGLLHETRTMMVGWIRHVAEVRGIDLAEVFPEPERTVAARGSSGWDNSWSPLDDPTTLEGGN